MRADETGVSETMPPGFCMASGGGTVPGRAHRCASGRRPATPGSSRGSARCLWLALPAHDNDLDRQCDADRVTAVHAGLRGLPLVFLFRLEQLPVSRMRRKVTVMDTPARLAAFGCA